MILSCIACCALSFFIYLCNISCFKFFGFDRAILMFTFFSAGIIISRIKLDKINKVCILLTGFFSLIILVVFGVILNTKVSVYLYQLGRYPFFLLSSFGGSLASIVLCYVFFNKKCFLSELSKYGILFLGTQYFLIGPFRYVMKRQDVSPFVCDSSIIVLVVVYILILPRCYRSITSHFPYLKVFNGEIK